MKFKYIPDFNIIVSNEPIKEGELCLVDGGLGRIGIDTFLEGIRYSVTPWKIIAGLPKFPSIDYGPFKEKLGSVNSEKLAEEYVNSLYSRHGKNYYSKRKSIGTSTPEMELAYYSYKEGFEIAQSLMFTKKDMEDAIEFGIELEAGLIKSKTKRDFNSENPNLSQFLRLRTQSKTDSKKEIEVEIECENEIPKITNNKIKITRVF